MSEKALFELMIKFINHPLPQICKHLVCLEIFGKMEQIGFQLDDKLIKNLVDCDDEIILKQLKEKINNID